MNKLRTWLKKHRRDAVLITLVMVVCGVAHGFNMYHYPYYENDEATYLARGEQFLSDGQLDLYTYAYDHPPMGWILIGIGSAILRLTPFAADDLQAGRLLMLVLHMLNTGMLYVLMRRVAKDRITAILACLMYSITPFGIYFMRRILLDNVLTTLLMGSLVAATGKKQSLWAYALSGVLFGLACMTKLSALFVGPAILYAVFKYAHAAQRRFAIALWLGFAGIIFAQWFIYAGLKAELFPAQLDADGRPMNVSLADTTKLQASRGVFKLPWLAGSEFRKIVGQWLGRDWLLFGTLPIALLVSGLYARKQVMLRIFIAFVGGLLLFLMRGKLAMDFYVLPVLPLIAGLLAYALVSVKRFLPTLEARQIYLAAVVCMLPLSYLLMTPLHYQLDETTNQTRAAQWVIQNVPKDAVMIIDNYAYPALEDAGFTSAYYMFPAERDPEVTRLVENKTEYILVTQEVIRYMGAGQLPVTKDAFLRSKPVAIFEDNSTSYQDLDQFVSTNGDWARVYKVDR